MLSKPSLVVPMLEALNEFPPEEWRDSDTCQQVMSKMSSAVKKKNKQAEEKAVLEFEQNNLVGLLCVLTCHLLCNNHRPHLDPQQLSSAHEVQGGMGVGR